MSKQCLFILFIVASNAMGLPCIRLEPGYRICFQFNEDNSVNIIRFMPEAMSQSREMRKYGEVVAEKVAVKMVPFGYKDLAEVPDTLFVPKDRQTQEKYLEQGPIGTSGIRIVLTDKRILSIGNTGKPTELSGFTAREMGANSNFTRPSTVRRKNFDQWNDPVAAREARAMAKKESQYRPDDFETTEPTESTALTRKERRDFILVKPLEEQNRNLTAIFEFDKSGQPVIRADPSKLKTRSHKRLGLVVTPENLSKFAEGGTWFKLPELGEQFFFVGKDKAEHKFSTEAASIEIWDSPYLRGATNPATKLPLADKGKGSVVNIVGLRDLKQLDCAKNASKFENASLNEPDNKPIPPMEFGGSPAEN